MNEKDLPDALSAKIWKVFFYCASKPARTICAANSVRQRVPVLLNTLVSVFLEVSMYPRSHQRDFDQALRSVKQPHLAFPAICVRMASVEFDMFTHPGFVFAMYMPSGAP